METREPSSAPEAQAPGLEATTAPAAPAAEAATDTQNTENTENTPDEAVNPDAEGAVELEACAAMAEEAAQDAPEAPDATAEETAAEVLQADADAEVAKAEEEGQEAPAPREPMTKEQVMTAIAEMAGREGADIPRDEVSRLRKAFADIRQAEIDALREQYQQQYPDATDFAAPSDDDEERVKVLLAQIKDKKAAYVAQLEAERAANLDRKQAIVDEIITLAADTDNVNRTYPRFQELRTAFLEAGDVTPSAETDIQRAFKDAQERYYDQLKINKDLRDYDFKKNLDLKMLLIDEAQKLTEEADVVAAFRRLQELHAKWRETGPVAKEIREEVWNRFKDYSATINKKYQTFFEARKAQERANEEAKEAICAEVEALDFSALSTFPAWDAMTKQILDAQARWKGLGFASRKANNALFTRFRTVCDKFFTAKADYFKASREFLSANLAKKVALCEKAEALKDSTDWRDTTQMLVDLQKEWKTIGPCSKRQSDAVWRRFTAACDAFFDAKKKATGDVRRTEQDNLKAKRALIATVEGIADGTPDDEAAAIVRDAQAQWGEIGHVPFREKNKVYDAWRAAVDSAYERFDIRGQRASMARFETSVRDMGGDTSKMSRERERLLRALDGKRLELHTIENNMGFFNSKTPAGDAMIRELTQKVERIREELAQIQQKIALLDSQNA